MAERYVSDGMVPSDGEAESLAKRLGRPLHRYRDVISQLLNAK